MPTSCTRKHVAASADKAHAPADKVPGGRIQKKPTEAGKTSGKRTAECITPVEEAETSAGKSKKASKAAPATKQIPAKEDGTGTFTISAALSDK